MGGWNGGLDVLESVYSKIILTELGTGCRGIHCKILLALLACLKMFIINVRINLLKWKIQFAAIWMENNCDLSPFVTRGYFAYLLQDSIKILCRSLCNRARFIKFRRVLPSFLIHLYHLDTFGLVFSSHNSLSPPWTWTPKDVFPSVLTVWSGSTIMFTVWRTRKPTSRRLGNRYEGGLKAP